jgi:hypothetical protein
MESDPDLDPDPLVRGTDPGDPDPGPHQNITDPQLLMIHEVFASRILYSVQELCRWFRFAQLAKGKKFRP